MKRISTIILALLIPLACMAQAKVTIVSKKEKLADFPVKTMKVVLQDDDFASSALREAMRDAWSVSAFEFCDQAEFDRLKGNGGYYFMVPLRYEGKKSDGITYLTVVKGDAKELDSMTELVTMPICAADGPDGREEAFMPAILDVMQRYIEISLVDGFKSISSMVEKAPKGGTMDLVIDEKDLGDGVPEKVRQKKLAGLVRPSHEVSEIFMSGAPDTAVAYTIAPVNPGEGAVCYRMLFDARSHALYHFAKHKIAPGSGKGLLKEDISTFTAGRK